MRKTPVTTIHRLLLFPDLARHWKLMDLKTLFREGDHDVLTFFRNIQSHRVYFYEIQVDGVVSGSVWLTDFEVSRCQVHFSVYKTQMVRHADVVGREVLQQLSAATGLHKFLGFVPTWNRRANKFTERLGMVLVGTIPEYEWDVYNETYSDANIYSSP